MFLNIRTEIGVGIETLKLFDLPSFCGEQSHFILKLYDRRYLFDAGTIIN